MNKLTRTAIAFLIVAVVLSIIAQGTSQSTKTIDLQLEYQSGTPWDSDDDGIALIDDVIDFTVGSTTFNWGVNESKLATKWELYSLDNGTVTAVCYGGEAACNYIGLVATRTYWNDTFDLYHGLFDAGFNNMVGARVLFVDTTLNATVLTSEVEYSNWANLSAMFIAPSSFVGTQSGVAIVVQSPDNSSPLASGENVMLNFTVDLLAAAAYSLDGAAFVSLGNNTTFSVAFSGTLNNGVLTNGNHAVNLSVVANNVSTPFSHSFEMQDSVAPVITLNLTNNTVIFSESSQHSVRVFSDEFASIMYSVNGGVLSGPIDLGSNRSADIVIDLQDGQNILAINASDYHNNSRMYEFTFTFSHVGSCSDGVQNDNETGIDCGGGCPVCVVFNVTTDKNVYDVGETVLVNVEAWSNSTVNLTVSQGGTTAYSYVFVSAVEGFPINETRVVTGITGAGIYTVDAVMTYLNITKLISFDFSVISPAVLSVSLGANATTIDEGDTVGFSASVSGSEGVVSYVWDFENDGTIDSNGVAPVKMYANNGTYVVNVTVIDSLLSATDTTTITVRKLYNVTVYVKDNSSDSVLNDAVIELSDIEKNSSNDGSAAFVVREGVYRLTVSKDGYVSYANDTRINSNNGVTVTLTERDETVPVIELISPDNDSILNEREIIVTYTARDQSELTCRVYVNHESSGWVLRKTNNVVLSGEESSFELEELQEGVHAWRIDCDDARGNTASSDERTFIVDVSAEEVLAEIEDPDIQEAITEINAIIGGLIDLSGDEKEAAEALQLERTLERSRLFLQRAGRDLYNLRWRRLNETDEKGVTDEIYDRIQEVKDSTPRTIRVIEQADFVKYPEKKDVENATAVYLEYSNIQLSKKQKSDLVKKNVDLQSLISVRTKAKIVDIEFLSGETETITLVQKTVTGKDDLTGHTFFEIIPKEIAQRINETVLLFDYNVIEEDPIIEIDLENVDTFVYYVKKQLNLGAVEDTRSVLLTTEIDDKQKNRLTGFAVFDRFSGLLRSSEKRLVIEIIVIIILLGVYLVYTFGSPMALLGLQKGHKELKIIEEKIVSAEGYLGQKQYTEAVSVHKEITTLFKSLPTEVRKEIYTNIVNLGHQIDVLYINRLLDAAFDAIGNNKQPEATEAYKKISQIYHAIAPAYKADVLKRCMELSAKLTGKGSERDEG